jgi:hypothetical protein
MALQLFPLTGGLNQQIDARLLPDGVLANAVNCEMTRVGRLQARAKYTALAATSYDTSTLTAYDLFSVDDRLYALGDRLGKGWPSDIFEYVNGGAAAWAPTSRGGDPKLSPATRVRDIGRPPDVKDGSTNHSCASVGNYVCLAFNNATSGYVHIFLADEDKTILFTDPSPVRVKAKAIGLSDRFLVLGLNVATTTLGAHRFIPASDDNAVTLGNGMYSGLGAISVFAAVKVTGSDQVVVAANCNGTVIAERRRLRQHHGRRYPHCGGSLEHGQPDHAVHRGGGRAPSVRFQPGDGRHAIGAHGRAGRGYGHGRDAGPHGCG